MNVALLRVLYAHALVRGAAPGTRTVRSARPPARRPQLGMAGVFLSLHAVLPNRYPGYVRGQVATGHHSVRSRSRPLPLRCCLNILICAIDGRPAIRKNRVMTNETTDPAGFKTPGRSRPSRWDLAGAAAVIAAIAGLITALTGAFSGSNKDAHSNTAPSSSATTTTITHNADADICSVRGINDGGYLNAVLSGRSGSAKADHVVAVAVFIYDTNRWSFRRVNHVGENWTIDASDLWEVGMPKDPPDTRFSFSAIVMTQPAKIPGETKELRTIPTGLRVVGREVTRTQRQMLHQRYSNLNC
jgi:hypothetical protein